MKKFLLIILSVTIISVLISISFLSPTYQVAEVIDGDTIVLTNGMMIRYIGIDTPELDHADKSVKYFAYQVYLRNKSLVEGKKIKLKFDSYRKKDKHGRYLAYVYVNGKLINELFIEKGLAYVHPCFKNKEYRYKFLQLQNMAKNRKIGIWQEIKYVANKKDNTFHHYFCKLLKDSRKYDKIYFDNKEEAINSGFVACKFCKP